MAEQPEDLTLRFLQAGIFALTEDLPDTEVVYRALLDDVPDNEQVFRNLYALMMSQEREDDAGALLEQVLTATPTAFTLNMVKAGGAGRFRRCDRNLRSALRARQRQSRHSQPSGQSD